MLNVGYVSFKRQYSTRAARMWWRSGRRWYRRELLEQGTGATGYCKEAAGGCTRAAEDCIYKRLVGGFRHVAGFDRNCM